MKLLIEVDCTPDDCGDCPLEWSPIECRLFCDPDYKEEDRRHSKCLEAERAVGELRMSLNRFRESVMYLEEVCKSHGIDPDAKHYDL